MGTNSVALAAWRRSNTCRKTISFTLLGGAAMACLVVGCGWTIYNNILCASTYPTLKNAGYDEPLVKQIRKVPTRSAAQAINDAFASLAMERAKLKAAPAISPSMFNERFGASEPSSVPSRAAEAALPPEAPKMAAAVKPIDASTPAEAAKSKEVGSRHAPQQVVLNMPPTASPVETRPPARASGISLPDMAARAKVAMLSITSGGKQSVIEKLWGKQASQRTLLAYASADGNLAGSLEHEQNPTHGGSPPYDRSTAVYDISAHTVYLPDGTKLEAHSGLGSKLDDPTSAPIRMRGATPPHIYELKPRETLFHGVQALRLNPIGGDNAIYGRAGLLAHTYMLGPKGDSNGCVSFRDYNAFLNAYRNMGIRKLAVVARIG